MNPDEDLAARVQELTAEVRSLRRIVQIESERRKRAELELAALKDQSAEEMSGMRRLHELSTRFASRGTLQELLDDMMDAAISITAADMGTLQLLDESAGTLRIVAQRGFDLAFCDFFENVRHGDAACGTALERRERVVVEDVARSPIFAGTPALHIVLAAGVRAVQSTPLISRSGELMGMCSTHYRAPHRPTDRQLRLLDLLVRQAADLIEQARAEDAMRQSREDLRALTVRLQRTGEQERASLAREIHDELSGSLTALKMDLSLLPDRLDKNRRSFLEKIKGMSELIDRTLERVQSIVSELRPIVLDKFGLTAAMEWQAREFQARFGIPCDLQLPAEEMPLEPDRATALFRIFQEALTNVARHANASVVTVKMTYTGENFILEIHDNGRGIDEGKIFDPASIGLLGMRERALSCGGSIETHRPPEGGTLVKAIFPLK